MLDQMVRERSGGDMWEATQAGHYDSEYARERFADVFEEFLPRPAEKRAAPAPAPAKLSWLRVVRRLLGRAYRSTLGRRPRPAPQPIDPRQSFEADKWLHDRLSLRVCMEQAGFRSYRVTDHRSSDVPGWDRFKLDTSRTGDHAIEPSLYVEARK